MPVIEQEVLLRRYPTATRVLSSGYCISNDCAGSTVDAPAVCEPYLHGAFAAIKQRCICMIVKAASVGNGERWQRGKMFYRIQPCSVHDRCA